MEVRKKTGNITRIYDSILESVCLISLPAVKYSNYMMMSYFIAIATGYFLADKLGNKSKSWILWVRNLAIGSLVFAIFPVAKEIRRDPKFTNYLN